VPAVQYSGGGNWTPSLHYPVCELLHILACIWAAHDSMTPFPPQSQEFSGSTLGPERINFNNASSRPSTVTPQVRLFLNFFSLLRSRYCTYQAQRPAQDTCERIIFSPAITSSSSLIILLLPRLFGNDATIILITVAGISTFLNIQHLILNLSHFSINFPLLVYFPCALGAIKRAFTQLSYPSPAPILRLRPLSPHASESTSTSSTAASRNSHPRYLSSTYFLSRECLSVFSCFYLSLSLLGQDDKLFSQR
jgi:hypothetical protein